jgi:hypothetical protein
MTFWDQVAIAVVLAVAWSCQGERGLTGAAGPTGATGPAGPTAAGTVYVSTDGDEANAGTVGAPVGSLARAIALLRGTGEIVLRGGDYPAPEVLTDYSDVRIVAAARERVRFVAGLQVTGLVKVDGYAKVYRADWLSEPTAPWFWEHERPEEGTTIADPERHPLHRGRTHRLPSTRIRRVESVEAIEAATEPSWWWGSGTLFLSVTDGADATRAVVYYPASRGIVNGTAGMPHLEIAGVEVWYGEVDARATEYELRDVLVLGGPSPGCVQRDFARATEVRVETGGCANDGANGHSVPMPAYALYPTASTVVTVDSYSHDNFDDGDSVHERSEGTYYGGLWEYNGDRGVATAYGAHVTIIGGRSRRNGGIDPFGGEGFGVVGACRTCRVRAGSGLRWYAWSASARATDTASPRTRPTRRSRW